jgi:hypothetical protein
MPYVRQAAGNAHGRVAPGDFSPRAPTDPDLQISRIRLFDLRIRCARVNAVNNSWGQEWIALQQLLESRPGHVRTMVATVEPLAPGALRKPQIATECARVPRHTVVRVMAP